MLKLFQFTLFTLYLPLAAQFPGPVGSINTTAMHKDSSAFKGWANSCIVIRGWQDIAAENLGLADVGKEQNATGKAGENPIVSLGDGGEATLTFQPPIKNGTGFDFAVFENAFNNNFLELAFVEVSSDGVNFVRFPSHSHTSNTIQIGPFDELGDATKLHNLAGKYRAGYGTPFDLEELEGVPNLNTQAITHVKIIDVVGCIAAPYARFDSNNNPINDPYPTAFGSGGFDLDAIGVINQAPIGIEEEHGWNSPVLYPNPCNRFVYIQSKTELLARIELINESNIVVMKEEVQLPSKLDTDNLTNGVYIIKIISNNFIVHKKIIVAKTH